MDGVFSGKVVKFIEKGSEMEATVSVTKAFKGEAQGEVIVRTGTGIGDCGFPFQVGKGYLIYAVKETGLWRTNICTRTQAAEDAANEILELEGRLPAPKVPVSEPVLKLEGKINDGGREGLVFVLRNGLHQRIFYFDYLSPLHLIQVNVKGRWEFYPSNYQLGPRKELSKVEAAKTLADFNRFYSALEPASYVSYLDRLQAFPVFVAKPTSARTWRAGFQYLTEAEMDAGKRIQDSKHYVWSEPVSDASVVRELSYKEAFAK